MIPVQNVYYMLSYAFRVLQEQGYQKLSVEKFHNTAELFAAILEKGVSIQLKRGLGRDYLPKTETISTLKGKLNISDSIKTQALMKKQMVCSYDDFSVNTEMNRILKSTMLLLLKADITPKRKKSLRKLMVFFSDVDTIDLHTVNWNQRYHRNNQSYQMLISICYLVFKGLLQTQSNGTMKLMDYLDEQRMCRLYEKFILEYYRQEHPKLSAQASQVAWQLDDGFDDMLPQMQTDVTLTPKHNPSKVLIIDAKYYEHTTQSQYGANTLHSGNLYQIFTYVKNKEHQLKDYPHTVSGMLLYAKTDEAVVPENKTYFMSGNKIIVTNLDLNCDFSAIKKQLDDIVQEFFYEEKSS